MIQHAQLSVEELLAPFRNYAAEVAPEQHDLLDEIERRLASTEAEPVNVLPIAITDRVRELFGPGARTFNAVSKRCTFALQIWDGKYGPLTPEQHEYAVSIILWALDAKTIAAHGNGRACAYERLDRVVHHERTHEGFKTRQGLVDVTAELAAL